MRDLKKLSELIEEKERLLEKYIRIQKIEDSKKNISKRKKRAHKLIQLGALFEIAGLDDENKNFLLGYLKELDLNKLSHEEKSKMEKKGQHIFDLRLQEKKKK